MTFSVVEGTRGQGVGARVARWLTCEPQAELLHEWLSFLLLKEQLHFLHLIVPHSHSDLTIRDGRIGTRSN